MLQLLFGCLLKTILKVHVTLKYEFLDSARTLEFDRQTSDLLKTCQLHTGTVHAHLVQMFGWWNIWTQAHNNDFSGCLTRSVRRIMSYNCVDISGTSENLGNLHRSLLLHISCG